MGGGEAVYSVGHSTRSQDELLALLADAHVLALADVRRYPHSRRHPHFDREMLETTLDGAGLHYEWLGDTLGGRQPEILPPDESPNRGWQEPAFRRYADAMHTAGFHAGLVRLELLAKRVPTAVMCAERLWWKCHRRLLADLLTVRGWRVVHLLEPGKRTDHVLTEFARVEGDELSYPGLL